MLPYRACCLCAHCIPDLADLGGDGTAHSPCRIVLQYTTNTNKVTCWAYLCGVLFSYGFVDGVSLRWGTLTWHDYIVMKKEPGRNCHVL